jgi:hypothetical protein
VRSDGYGFQIEMAYRAARARGGIVEVPVEFIDRERGTSKMSFRIVVDALLLLTWWGVSDLPSRRRALRRPGQACFSQQVTPQKSRTQ